jgi:hypothetical protein
MATLGPYFVTLKSKLGETEAIRALDASTRSTISPIFEIPNYLGISVAGKAKQKTFDERFASCCENIAKAWSGDQLAFLDFDFSDDRRLKGRVHPAEKAYGDLLSKGVNLAPVMNLDRDSDFISIARNLAYQVGGVFAIRLFDQDLQLPGQSLDKVQDWAKAWRLDLKRAILILDFRSVLAWRDDEIKAIVRAFCGDRRSAIFAAIIVSGSNMPRSEDIPQGVSRQSRREWNTWKELVRNHEIAFGDYAITFPDFVDIDRRGAAKIRYATEHDWIFVKGKLLSKKDPLQYQRLAVDLSKQAGFRSNESSFGDKFIKRCFSATDKLGNLTQWVTVDTSIHLEITSKNILKHLAISGRSQRVSVT